MSEASSTTLPATAAIDSAADARASAADIDASCRWPLLLLFLSATLWLCGGTVLALISSIKMHAPGFLDDCAWVTLGRIRPAAINSILYGFASQAGIAVMLWMMCRLGGVRLGFQWPVIVAWKLWNIAVTVGVFAILAGGTTGFEWLEMPRSSAGMLFVAYAIFGLAAIATFTMRRQHELFPSQWYLLGALFWFPWIYSAANYLLVLDPVRGTLQAAVNAWFTGNFVGLWLAPVSLAGIFYFVPKLTGQPLASRELAAFAFWTYAFFTSWSGLTGLIGGPVPRWMPAVSTAATVCLLVPLISNVLIWRATLCGNAQALKKDAVLRFIRAGAFCFVLHGLVSILMALPAVSAVTNLTYATVARNHLALHGFVALVLFGSLYYIVPRLAQVNWPNEASIQRHLLCQIIGVALLFVALGLGGLSQGIKLANPAVTFAEATGRSGMFVGLSTLGLLVLLMGQVIFLSNFIGVLRGAVTPLMNTACNLCGCTPATKAGGKR